MMPYFHVITLHPVAFDSPDHITPVGTKNDNSANRNWNRKLYELIPAGDVRLLDLGCAGGALVKSILDDGGVAVGIEGSDDSLLRRRAEWATIPGHLFTADATEPFVVVESAPESKSYTLFNVITAWEFLEHVAEDKLPALADNIRFHLAPGGFFFGSVATQPDVQNGVQTNLHQTVKPRDWWIETMTRLGFRHDPALEEHFGDDVVRGSRLNAGGFTLGLRAC
jgi:hypothetical protein